MLARRFLKIPVGALGMKPASALLKSTLVSAQGTADARLFFAECFTFILASGSVYRWTNVDFDITYQGNVFSASGPLVQGLKFKQTVGLEVDKQQITIAARPTDLISGAQVLIDIRIGGFDGASVQRDRVFLTPPASFNRSDFNEDFNNDFGPAGYYVPPSAIDGVTLFKGRVSTVDSIGRTTATLTIASDLVVLDYDMPRNLFSPTCSNSLYDYSCGLDRTAHQWASSCGAGSTALTIVTVAADAAQAQGSIVMTSGANLGVRADRYLAAGGWADLPTAEDHDLWRRLHQTGARTCSSAKIVVATSGRRIGRAPHGFAGALAAHNLEARI